MTDNATAPHILIEGRPVLTKRLWDSCRIKPLVLTSRLLNSPVYLATRDDLANSDVEPIVYSLAGTALLPRVGKHYPDIVAQARRSLENVVAMARERFGLGPDEEVRIAVAGDQGSLWLREHSNVGMPGWMFPEAQDDEEDAPALRQLGRAAQNRGFVKHLHSALKDLDGVRICWLSETFSDLRGEPSEHKEFQKLAAQAREMLAGKISQEVQGAVPLLYWRRDSGPWYRFGEILGAEKASSRGRNPYRTTSQLIQQYRDFHGREGLTCVLVKVVPRPSALTNPCDNPIITTAHLQQARDAGISAVLLDSAHGVVDLTDEQDFLESFLAWQRGNVLVSLRGALPLREELTRIGRVTARLAGRVALTRRRLPRHLAKVATYLEERLAELIGLRDVLADIDERDPFDRVDLGKARPIFRIRADFRPFERFARPAEPRPDPTGDHRPPAPRWTDIEKTSENELLREFSISFGHVATELERAALAGPINAGAARKIVASLSYDLASAMRYANEFLQRTEVVRRRDELLRPGLLRRIWDFVTGRGAIEKLLSARVPPSAASFIDLIHRLAALERTLAAAAEGLHGQDAAYPGGPDYPPIYRV